MKNFIPTIVLLTFLSIFFFSCSQLQKQSEDISLSELRELNNPCEYLNAFFTLYDAAYEIYLNDNDKENTVLLERELLQMKLEFYRARQNGGVLNKYNDSIALNIYETYYSEAPFIKNHKEQFLAGYKSIQNSISTQKYTDQQINNLIDATEDTISEINKREDITPENKERWKKIRKKHEDITEIILTKFTPGELEECEKWDTIKQVAGRQWYRDFWKLLP
jgi:hypothetical protein